ncbi:MAG TPA: energy-coupling factor transporter transmembrane component T [Candidatus Limnocylindrales bacterium]|jgi:energy-coupling factor transport system permease protein|nr:energy-coupling factor transporter transmembrane component T [Candidatus Limnocylindrales bacterium]
MQLMQPLVPDPAAPLARSNPVAKLGAATILMATLFVAVDPVTPALVLAAELAAVRLAGIPARTLARRIWPLGLAALGVGFANALLAAEPGGTPIVGVGPFALTTGSLLIGLALALRVAGIAFVGVLALATTDPTDLADSLVQQLRVPPRVAVGSLAAFRLLPIFAQEWETLRLARRARGVDAGRSPVAAMRIFFGMTLAMLVAAIRRGIRLAIAMEARGFGTRDCRTSARPQPMRPTDWALIGAAAAIGIGATAISVALGTWRPLLG